MRSADTFLVFRNANFNGAAPCLMRYAPSEESLEVCHWPNAATIAQEEEGSNERIPDRTDQHPRS